MFDKLLPRTGKALGRCWSEPRDPVGCNCANNVFVGDVVGVRPGDGEAVDGVFAGLGVVGADAGALGFYPPGWLGVAWMVAPSASVTDRSWSVWVQVAVTVSAAVARAGPLVAANAWRRMTGDLSRPGLRGPAGETPPGHAALPERGGRARVVRRLLDEFAGRVGAKYRAVPARGVPAYPWLCRRPVPGFGRADRGSHIV
jgi:hypothetical protein